MCVSPALGRVLITTFVSSFGDVPLSFKPQGHNERAQAAAAAKKAQLEQFRAKFGANDPNFAARQAERIATAQARAERQAERDRQKAIEAEAAAKRAEEERLAREEAERIAREEAERLAAEEADRLVAAEAAAKAERDRRYAERKARGIKRGPKK
jgi:protein required for attachment to host cells